MPVASTSSEAQGLTSGHIRAVQCAVVSGCMLACHDTLDFWMMHVIRTGIAEYFKRAQVPICAIDIRNSSFFELGGERD